MKTLLKDVHELNRLPRKRCYIYSPPSRWWKMMKFPPPISPSVWRVSVGKPLQSCWSSPLCNEKADPTGSTSNTSSLGAYFTKTVTVGKFPLKANPNLAFQLGDSQVGGFCPQRSLVNVCRHFWLPHWGWAASGAWWTEARDVAEHPTVHKTTPPQKKNPKSQ